MKSSGIGNKEKKKKVFFKLSHSCERLRKMRLICTFTKDTVQTGHLISPSRYEADLQNCLTCREVSAIFVFFYDMTDQTDRISRAAFNKNAPCHKSIFFQLYQLPLLVST